MRASRFLILLARFCHCFHNPCRSTPFLFDMVSCLFLTFQRCTDARCTCYAGQTPAGSNFHGENWQTYRPELHGESTCRLVMPSETWNQAKTLRRRPCIKTFLRKEQFSGFTPEASNTLTTQYKRLLRGTELSPIYYMKNLVAVQYRENIGGAHRLPPPLLRSIYISIESFIALLFLAPFFFKLSIIQI